MKIGSREVGLGAPVFIIAELGSNHGGSLDAALALIDAAADAGADAAKLQYFRVDRFLVPRENPETLRKYELPDAWLPALKKRCYERGIVFLCTAFDLASLDAVDPFVHAHKVGSFEAASDDYLSAVFDKGKPFIISNGVTRKQHHGYCKSSITLECISKYPAPIAGYLSSPPMIMCAWGVSDHTIDPLTVPCAAVALGACVVEKHFMLRDTEPGPDVMVSLRPTDFREMARAIRLTESAIR